VSGQHSKEGHECPLAKGRGGGGGLSRERVSKIEIVVFFAVGRRDMVEPDQIDRFTVEPT
jgi:hypothetical protein